MVGIRLCVGREDDAKSLHEFYSAFVDLKRRGKRQAFSGPFERLGVQNPSTQYKHIQGERAENAFGDVDWIDERCKASLQTTGKQFGPWCKVLCAHYFPREGTIPQVTTCRSRDGQVNPESAFRVSSKMDPSPHQSSCDATSSAKRSLNCRLEERVRLAAALRVDQIERAAHEARECVREALPLFLHTVATAHGRPGENPRGLEEEGCVLLSLGRRLQPGP